MEEGSFYRGYKSTSFGNPFSIFRGSWKNNPAPRAATSTRTAHVPGSFHQYLNCATGRLTPVCVTYHSDLSIFDALPPPSKIFRLNPDAKSFVPMNLLNPYAEEFKPKKCFLPHPEEEEEELRHKKRSSCSNSSEEDDVSSGEDISILPPSSSSHPEEGSLPPQAKGQEEEPFEVISSLEISSVEEEELNLKRKAGICDRLRICTLGGDSSETEDSDSEDDDWDDLEFGSPTSPSAWEDIPDEFKGNMGLVCPLSSSLEPVSSNTSRVKEFLKCASAEDEASEEEEDDDEEDLARERELQERLAAINKEWTLHYHHPRESSSLLPSPPSCSSCNHSLKKNVSFSSEKSWRVIEEDPELALELRESRTSDHLARKADRERIEKVISPILSEEHRKRVYQRLYNDDYSSS